MAEFFAGEMTLLLLTKGDLMEMCGLHVVSSVSIQYVSEKARWTETSICLLIFLFSSVAFFLSAFPL